MLIFWAEGAAQGGGTSETPTLIFFKYGHVSSPEVHFDVDLRYFFKMLIFWAEGGAQSGKKSETPTLIFFKCGHVSSLKAHFETGLRYFF